MRKTVEIEGRGIAEGRIVLDRNGYPGMDISLACEDTIVGFKCMKHVHAIALRDALIELYPLPEKPKSPADAEGRYTVEEDALGYDVVERMVSAHSIARTYDRPTAEKIVTALNKEQGC